MAPLSLSLSLSFSRWHGDTLCFSIIFNYFLKAATAFDAHTNKPPPSPWGLRPFATLSIPVQFKKRERERERKKERKSASTLAPPPHSNPHSPRVFFFFFFNFFLAFSRSSVSPVTGQREEEFSKKRSARAPGKLCAIGDRGKARITAGEFE